MFNDLILKKFSVSERRPVQTLRLLSQLRRLPQQKASQPYDQHMTLHDVLNFICHGLPPALTTIYTISAQERVDTFGNCIALLIEVSPKHLPLLQRHCLLPSSITRQPDPKRAVMVELAQVIWQFHQDLPRPKPKPALTLVSKPLTNNAMFAPQ